MDARRPRYLSVRDELTGELNAGEWAAGAILPGETELADRYGVSRVTIRKALVLLKEQGILDSRRGFGWYVSRSAVSQSLDTLVTIEDQIAAAGHRPTRRLLSFAYRIAPDRVAQALGAGSVLEISRLNCADGNPVGRNTAWIADRLARDISVQDIEQRSLHRLLPVTVASATQTITAEAASPGDAELLHVATGAPLLRFNRITRDAVGNPVLYSEAVYNPERAEFTLGITASPQAQTAALSHRQGAHKDSAVLLS